MIRAAALVLLTVLCTWVPAGPADAKPDKWDKKLQKNDPGEVYQTIVNIGTSGNIAAAPALIRNGLEYTSPHLSVACGETLRALPQDELVSHLMKDKDFVKWWRKAAKEKDAERAMNMARVLGAWGHPMVDPVMAHLCSGRRPPEVQAEALFMAGSLKRANRFPETQEAILAGLSRGRTEVIKCAACSAAGRWQGKIFLDDLEKIVKRDTEDHPGLYAVWAMRQIGWDRGISSFIYVATKNPKRSTKMANLKAIAELCTPRDIDDLISLSRDRREEMRDAAVLGLARMAWRKTHGKFDPKPVPEDEAPVVTGPVKKDPTSKELPKPDLEIPEVVIDRFIQIVREDNAFSVRDAARQGLLRWGERARPKVVASMPELIDYSDQDTSRTAIELCGLFGARDSFDTLLKIAQFDGDRTRRMMAARALEGVNASAAAKQLAAAIRPRKSEKDVELRAVRALGYIRHMDAFNALLKLVSSPDEWSEAMRREGEFALERLTGRRFGRSARVWRTWLETAKHPLHPGIGTFDRAKNRREAIAGGLYGLTGRTERAVEDGLRWLEQHQEPLGTWDGNAKGFLGFIHCEPAYTGLILLAYLGAGYEGSKGKYREVIRRATEYLAASQFHDGGFPVTGGGDNSWIYAYSIAMAVWGLNESYGLSGDPTLAEPAQWGIDYLVRVQTPGSGWRYSARNGSDTSCTSWVLMATKMAAMLGLDVAQKSWDGIDDWLERSSLDITGEVEKLEDISSDYEHEVGGARKFKAFTSYFALEGGDQRGLRRVSMTSVGLVCRFFMGWQRGHPYMIGGSNQLADFLPKWMDGLQKEQTNTWYHYYWYYGTLAMHQMGGKYWRAWNQKIKKMYPDRQRTSPPELAGSWDGDTNKFGGGRLFSTATAILTLESYYRFSPLFAQNFGEEGEVAVVEDQKEKDLEGLWE